MKNNQIEELYKQYAGAMEEWQLKLAFARMKEYRLPIDAWEDTMQELAIVISQFQFDPAKAKAASEETILCRMIDNCIRMLARSNFRQKAFIGRLGKMRIDEQDDHRPEVAFADKQLDELVTSMGPLRREICQRLIAGENTSAIAQATGRAWTTIDHHIRQIKRALIKAGYKPSEGGQQ